MKDWECLEELLGWYLRMNGEMNHGFIVSAFVDLLMGISSSCSESTSFSSLEIFFYISNCSCGVWSGQNGNFIVLMSEIFDDERIKFIIVKACCIVFKKILSQCNQNDNNSIRVHCQIHDLLDSFIVSFHTQNTTKHFGTSCPKGLCIWQCILIVESLLLYYGEKTSLKHVCTVLN